MISIFIQRVSDGARGSRRPDRPSYLAVGQRFPFRDFANHVVHALGEGFHAKNSKQKTKSSTGLLFVCCSLLFYLINPSTLQPNTWHIPISVLIVGFLLAPDSSLMIVL